MATPQSQPVPYWATLEAPEPGQQQEQLRCSICLEHPPGIRAPEDPPYYHAMLRIRNCGHAFGRECLLDLYDADVRMNKCPTCRQPFRPPRTLIYDPTEDLIVPEEGNWAMNVPGQPGMRKSKKDPAASASQQSEEESFYDLDFYDRADEERLARRALLAPFYVSGKYGSFRGQVWDDKIDERGMVYDDGYETVSEDEFHLLRELASQSADVDEHAPKDLERVQNQFVTMRARHLETNMLSLAEHMARSAHYDFPPRDDPDDFRSESLQQTIRQAVRWFRSNDGQMYQYKTLTKSLCQFMKWNWQHMKNEAASPAMDKILDHLVRGTVMARMFREMDFFGRLA